MHVWLQSEQRQSLGRLSQNEKIAAMSGEEFDVLKCRLNASYIREEEWIRVLEDELGKLLSTVLVLPGDVDMKNVINWFNENKNHMVHRLEAHMFGSRAELAEVLSHTIISLENFLRLMEFVEVDATRSIENLDLFMEKGEFG